MEKPDTGLHCLWLAGRAPCPPDQRKPEGINLVGTNISVEDCARNIAYARSLGLPEVKEPADIDDAPAVIAGAGPSLGDTWGYIRDIGGKIWSCRTASYLMDKGIRPDAIVHTDASTSMDDLDGRTKDIPHYLASCIRSDTFDTALAEGYNVILWHPWHNTEADPHDAWLIGNGANVGIRSIFLAMHLGQREIHLFGLDGNMSDRVHVYDPDDNKYGTYGDGDNIVRIAVNGREFRTYVAFLRTAMLIRMAANNLRGVVDFRVYGDSMLAAIMAPKDDPKLEARLTKTQQARLANFHEAAQSLKKEALA